ncbi:MAG: BMP family ABC transporter substrate-binding protein, partial [Clostridiales bacterium]|nr:BMP family ABC transporter substrate-binding protein [Clostridiales bacterium]
MQIKPESIYQEARRLGQKEYSRRASMGTDGYLPSLDDLLKNIETSTEKYLGIVEIPLKKIVGTYTNGRSTSFAANFMPLLEYHTEFGQKWGALCEAHMTEGIRDPIKVYEYLNWFYVMEGNKRVSVLKYYDAYSITGHVYRVIPKKVKDDPTIVLYYEFMDFYAKTGINAIWFSKKRSFEQLFSFIEEIEVDQNLFPNKYKYFCNSVYLPFRREYLALGGQKLDITTGDAFLEFIKVYGIPEDVDDDMFRTRLSHFMTELEQLADGKTIEIQTMPQKDASVVIPTISIFGRQKKTLKVAFVYDFETTKSSWSYSHEMGRNHVDNVLKDYITTSFIEGIHMDDAYESLSKLAREGNDVVFVTSPMFINATLKAALEFPATKFLNCSETHSFRHVNTYFGRIYEPRFLAGMIAGILTKSNIIGYAGTTPHPGLISSINSFSLGARMVNPDVTVRVSWESDW